MVQPTFQTAVNRFSGFLNPGVLYSQGPVVADSFILNSGANVANQLYGRAACLSSVAAPGQNIANVGNTGGQVYLGIIAGPEEGALYGTAGQPLSPTLQIPNNAQVAIVKQGIMAVFLNSAANIGDVVIFNNTTGVLSTQAPGTALPSGFSNAYATVYGFALSQAGLAVIYVNPQAAILTTQVTIIPEITVTWGGSGASFARAATGVLPGDKVLATITVAPTQAAYLVSAIAGTNIVTFTLSAANTSNDAQITFNVVRG